MIYPLHNKADHSLVRFYQRYGKHMVRKFRKSAQQRLGPDFFSARWEGKTAKYFLRCLDIFRNNWGSPGPMIESVRVRELPTWWEFVQHLIHTPSYR